MMHTIIVALAVGSSASVAAASPSAGFVFPAGVPLSKRQTSGPAYECHSDCGYAILSAEGGYCKDSGWLDLLDGCLDCALEYDIWQDYSEGVSGAAEACGLDATPIPADGEEATSTAGTTVAETTSATDSVEETTGTVATPPISTETTVASSATPTDLVSTPTGPDNTTATGGTTPVPTGAASQVWLSGTLVAGAAIALAASFV